MSFRSSSILSSLLSLLLASGLGTARAQLITIDEDFSDWEAVEPHYENAGAPFFRNVRLANDERHLFLSFELAEEHLFQEGGIRIMLDTDANDETGKAAYGIGVDLEWRFGDRVGFVYVDGHELEIGHTVIGLVSAPTVTSTRFEIALRRDAVYGTDPLFEGSTIRVVLADEHTQETAPEAGAFTYAFEDVVRERHHVSLARPEAADVRLVAYNVLSDGPFRGRSATFGRILSALSPDVIGFTEMYETPIDFVRDWLTRDVPGNESAQWHVQRAGSDFMLASRYPISSAQAVKHSEQFAPRSAVFTLDLRPAIDTELVVYVTHPSCCQHDVARQEQLDALMAHVREWRAGAASATPFLIVGDFNLVTAEAQRRTVLDGTISDTLRYGPTFMPDWNATPLADLRPPTTGLPMTFTWYDKRSDFSPGRLDYIVYSDSTLTAVNGFSLFTPALSDDELEVNGLYASDTPEASDHLPVVGDFIIRWESSTSIPSAALPRSGDLSITVHPNPVAGAATLTITGRTAEPISISLYDVLGRLMQVVEEAPVNGTVTLSVDTLDLAPGLYLVRASADRQSASTTIVVAR